ncbi:hypothetical protein [Lyngbya confervoides]|uniref:Uncharacterized protein n=1 Tax=Lyngbya confervoides BDU141951 TaxID=1574623 RepID=A0ABD4SYQ1_9CYAN|nr:hypothetical protein [Lyngbya confervoides]MCM1981587.1 hypothetical protein [Lyngbya confervoides BDU141951]
MTDSARDRLLPFKPTPDHPGSVRPAHGETPTQPIAAEVMDEAAYRQQQQYNQQQIDQDQAARARARTLLRRCREGFVPNLIHHPSFLPYDGILASKAIIRLLELSLHEDQRCALGAHQRCPFSRPESYRTAQSCGRRLHEIGGIDLMQQVLQDWIPAFDQPDLERIWVGIGHWRKQP